eukprot:5226193-Alexandrium_andersonii.AAC.1
MSASLVGSEMCIRDSVSSVLLWNTLGTYSTAPFDVRLGFEANNGAECTCLLYTSDAADDM